MKILQSISRATDRLPRFQASPNRSAAKRRLYELDGVRGWASLMVLLCHVIWEIAGARYTQLRNPILGFFLDGNFAVQVFFILSGEALSYSYFSGGGNVSVYRLAIKRYPRLTFPVAFASLLTFGLLISGLTFNSPAGDVLRSPRWLGSFLDVPASWGYYLYYTFIGMYVGTQPEHALIPFAWTMRIEMVGSILVFASLLLLSKLHKPWPIVLVITAAILCIPKLGNLACFLVGLTFAGLRVNGIFDHLKGLPRAQGITALVIITSAMAQGFVQWMEMGKRLPPVLAIVFLLAVFCNMNARTFFSNKVSRKLGEISFSLYLIQFPVFVSFTSYGALWLHEKKLLDAPHVAILCILTIALCLLIAALFHPVEVLTKWICDKTLKVAEHTPLKTLVKHRERA